MKDSSDHIIATVIAFLVGMVGIVTVVAMIQFIMLMFSI